MQCPGPCIIVWLHKWHHCIHIIHCNLLAIWAFIGMLTTDVVRGVRHYEVHCFLNQFLKVALAKLYQITEIQIVQKASRVHHVLHNCNDSVASSHSSKQSAKAVWSTKFSFPETNTAEIVPGSHLARLSALVTFWRLIHPLLLECAYFSE